MPADPIIEIAIDELLASPAVNSLKKAMDVIATVQKKAFALSSNGDGVSLNLLRIGTVFQIFLIDTLASGRKPSALTPDDWKKIAESVSEYAICEDSQKYTEFVFTLYADYINISVKSC